MYEIFWEYEVRPGQIAAFERLYGADGEWARLFRRADRPTRYLTIDRWRSRASYEAFVQAAKPAYAALDCRGDALTVHERRLGAFDA